jgi:hypothetical protein
MTYFLISKKHNNIIKIFNYHLKIKRNNLIKNVQNKGINY